MPLSPTNSSGASPTDYLSSWRAIERLVHRGASWSGRERNCLFLNTGANPDGLPARFATASAASGFDFPDDARALALFDHDFDGDLDVFVANRNGPRWRVLRNETRPGPGAAGGPHFLSLKLTGTRSNRDAVGAVVEVQPAGEAVIRRTVAAGDAYLSQSSPRLHFGLGTNPTIARVRVRWPSGTVTELPPPGIDRFHLLTEGESATREEQRPRRPGALAASTPLAPRPTSQARVPLSTPVPLPLPPGVSNGPVLLTLWASWCAPCRTEMAALAPAREELERLGLRVVALNVDEPAPGTPAGELPDAARAAQRQWPVPFPARAADATWLERVELLLDRLFDRHLPTVVPASFLVDRDGRLAVIYRGPVDPATLREDLRHLDDPPEMRRDRAVPFGGRWYGPPGQVNWEDFARDFQERFPADAERFLRLAGAPGAGTITNLSPAEAETRLKLALAELQQGHVEQSRRTIRELLAVQPDHPGANVFHAELLRAAGESAAAVAAYRTALRANPDDHDTGLRLAWLLATHPDRAIRDGAAAVELARRAAAAVDRADAQDTLAASLAETGRFAEAVAAVRRAISRAQADGDTRRVEAMTRRLREYGRGQPWREGK